MQKQILFLVAVAVFGFVSVGAYYSFGAKPKRPVIASTPVVDNGTQDVPDEDLPPQGEQPVIMTRAEWKAKPTRGEGKEHSIRCITIHHTGVAQKPGTTIEKKLKGLQSYSQSESKLPNGKLKPAWLDVPYHFYIAVDGKIAEGRPIRFVSDTNTEYDPTEHATIVLEGNFEEEQPTAEQLAALEAMTAWLAVKYQVPPERIQAHNDYAKTLCPGVNLKKTMPGLREKVAAIRRAK